MGKTIKNTKSNTLLSGGKGDDEIYNGGYWDDDSHAGGDNVTINGNKGDDYIENKRIWVSELKSYVGGSNVSIIGGAGDDSIDNEGSNVTIDGGAGNDSIYSYGDSVKIDLGADNDYVYDDGNYSTINTGTGNDSVYNSAYHNATINTGAGNDSVYSDNAHSAKINTGAGDDSVYNYISDYATINTGAGNDLISLDTNSNSEVIQYKTGDGNDIIYGFTGKLSISGSYSTQESGNDVLVTVGDGIITLKNAFALIDKLNINEKSISLKRKAIELTSGNNKLVASRDSLKIDAGEGNDSVSNYWSDYVTINASEGANTVSNWRGASIKIDTGAGNDSIYNYEGEYATINTGEGNDTVNNCYWSNYSRINTGEGNDSVYNYMGDYAKISTGSGNDSIYNISDKVTLNGGAGNDLITLSSSSSQNVIQYQSGDGNDTIYGFNSTSTLSISSDTYSTAESGYDVLVKVGKEKIRLKNVYATANNIHINKETIALERKAIKLTNGNDKLVSSRSSISIDSGAGNDLIDNDEGKYSTINTGIGDDSIYNFYSSHVTIDMGAGNDSVENWAGDSVTINTGAGDDFVDNNNSDYCTINTGAGNDSVQNGGSKCKINTGAGNDSVYNEYGYKCTINSGVGNDLISLDSFSSQNIVQYSSGDGNDIIYGFKKNSTLSIAGSCSSVTSGSDIIFTVGEGKITLVGAVNLSKVNVKGTNAPAETNSWKLNGTTATYGTSSKTLITVSGVKSLNGISLSGKVVTIAQASLGKNKITISDGYTLKLASDVANKSATSNAWTFDKKKSTATYAQTNKAYYSLVGDKKSITYNKASSKNLVTVSGVKSSSGLTLSGKTVTVAQAALGTNKITVSDGYTLKLADGVPISKSTSVSWTHDGTKAAYKSAGTTAGYILADNAITYSSAKAASTLATINGIKSNVNPAVKNKVITLTKGNLSSNKVTVSGNGYEFNFAKGDYNNTTITGSANKDIITSNGSNLVINGGAGNDFIHLNAAAENNLIVYSNGDGNDIINGLTSDDTIKIAGTAKVTTSGDDVIFTVGKGKITVKDAADKTFSYIANGKTETYTTVVADPYTISGAAITFSNSYTKKDFDVTKDVKGGNGIVTIDASAVNHDLNITGNAKANEILGGSGNDTLDGYSGNDTLTGGEGADIFIYYSGDGNDVISDYEAKDTIQIDSEKVTPSTKGRDVILKVGNEKITVQNAAKNKIGVTYTEDGVEYDYLNGEQTVIMNEKKTYATITKNYWKTGFDFANFGKSIQKADASAVTHALNITGNDKANVILGGSGKNTLTGGTGNDTLQGGDKADVFLYNKGDGNDVILGYGESDIISIAAGTVNNITVKGDTVILTVGKGKISVDGAAGETNITYYDANGRTSKIFSKENTNVVEPLWFAENNFSEDNQLNSIVQSKSADCSFLNVSRNLTLEKNFIAYGEKKSRG